MSFALTTVASRIFDGAQRPVIKWQGCPRYSAVIVLHAPPISAQIEHCYSLMSQLDDIIEEAKDLDPNDRLRLIARVWASLPREFWAAPSRREFAEIHSMIGSDDLTRMAALPSRIVQRVQGIGPVEEPKIYSAPRQFDLATIFVVTFAYSLLFALMSALSFPPVSSLAMGGFITLVGIGQAVLFAGRLPRAASLLTGAIACIPITIAVIMSTPRGFRNDTLLLSVPFSFIFGAGLGYLAGVLVGGVFLVADKIRQAFAGRKGVDEPLAEMADRDDD